MCGIVGFIDRTENKKPIIEAMKERIRHRGPDSDGTLIDGDVALGFVRLSVLDLEHGNQPIFNESETKAIIYNGEVYNYLEIKKELEDKGCVFKTNTDTEVILRAYEEYGPNVVERFRGMFAFVIWDGEKKELFGARDHFGIKPFYYVNDADKFMFGSEIKSFLEHPHFKKKVNKDAVKPYLTFQYTPLEETMFKGVYKLLPAHYFIYKDGDLELTKYYEYEYEVENKSYEEYLKETEDAVLESVKAHSLSDVEVGSYLSSGVDSSYVTKLLMPDKTFSVGFLNTGNDRLFNESTYAKELSDMIDVKHYDKVISADEFFEAVGDVQYHSDEPHANLSAVPLYFLSKLTKDHVKVVLSGEGADELFAGYAPYNIYKGTEKYRAIVPKPIRKIFAGVAKGLPKVPGRDFLIRASKDVEEYYIGHAFIFDDAEAKDILIGDYQRGKDFREITKPYFDKVKGYDPITKMLYLDMNLWLPHDILLKADKQASAHGVEARSPLLDKKLYEFANRIPNSYKLRNGESKYIFREAANKTLPKEWAMREKKGFPVPFVKWLEEDKYFNIVNEEFMSKHSAEFFDREKLSKLLTDHKNKKNNNGRKIWTIYAFLRWYKVYFIEN